MLRIALFALISTSVIATPSVAFAQSADGKTVPVARRLFNEGVSAANSEKWDVALERFTKSYELAPRLKTMFNVAYAQMKIGRLVDASETFKRFLRETDDGRHEQHRKTSIDSLSELERRIPFVTLRVLGIGPGDKISIDEAPFPQAGLGESVPLDPGSHSVAVTRDGVSIGKRDFTLGEGDAEAVEIVVPPRPEGPSNDAGGSGGGTEQPTGAAFAGNGQGPADGGDDESGGVLRSGWFWAAVAVVAVGGAGASYYFTRDLTEDPTAGSLGRGVIDIAP